MMPSHVVVAARGLDAAAVREVAALAQQPGAPAHADFQRDLQQAARQAAQEMRAAAQEARASAQEAAQEGARAQAAARSADVPAVAGGPRITKGLDGRMTVVNPNGTTVLLEPDGRYTAIDAKGQVTQSARALIPEQFGMDTGAALSLSALSSIVFFFLGRWWSARKYRSRVAEVATLASGGELGSRMERIEQAVEAVAIEVERISEGQRFTTKLLAEIRSPEALAVGEPRR